MAYSANGNNFPNKVLSRVKYDLLVYEAEVFYGADVPGVDIPDAFIPTGEILMVE